MKQLVRTYWPVMSGVFLMAAVGGGGWMWWTGSGANTTQAQEAPPAEFTDLDPVAASQIDRLRRDLGLDDDALVGLGVSAAQCEQILSRCRTAALEQAAQIHTLKVTIGQKEAALRDARRQIRIGPRDEALLASLPTLKQDIATARAAYEQFLAGVRTQVEADLTAVQVAQSAVLRANTGERMPDRLLALTAEQRAELKQARRQYRRRLAQADDATARAAAKTTHDQDRAAVLDATHDQVIADYQASAAATSVAVVEAVRTVLPVVDEQAGILP